MPKVSEALSAFLRGRATPCNGDLIERWLAHDLETQVNVRQGTPVEGRENVWTDGAFEFHSFRIPRHADTDPTFHDFELRYPLEDYASDVGTTGWDWAARRSLWAGYDLDTIIGHAPGVGVTDEEIERVCAALQPLPFVEIRRSTGGRGRHIYIHFDGIPTRNHAEHARLARAVKEWLSHRCGIDLSAAVDCVGGNMWFWSRRATEENRGLEQLKAATGKLTAADLPEWRDVDPFAEFAAAIPAVPLDEQHERILRAYATTGYALVHRPEHGCWHLHSAGLSKVHSILGLKGRFVTTSEGTDPGQPNCFGFLRPAGGMFVVRFGTSGEHPLWTKTKDGHPCIAFNEAPDIGSACLASGGVQSGKGWYFETFDRAQEAVRTLGLELPGTGDNRPVTIKQHADGVLAEVERRGRETLSAWAAVDRKLQRVLPFQEKEPAPDNFDHSVRQLVTAELADAGYSLRIETNEWVRYGKAAIEAALIARGTKKSDVPYVIGALALNPWFEVNEPFQPVFLPNRRWNLHGAKLRYVPSPGTHDHWDSILAHCGKGLDDAVSVDAWCAANGIATGADYLRLWVARLIREPKRPLPYLFFFSEGEDGQEAGKSSFHRAIGGLFDRGYTDAGLALTEQFNRQLAGAILCFIDERKFSEKEYLRLKELVDSPTITIRQMRTDAYALPNYTHWVHTSNDRGACPMFEGDRRITMVEVPPLKQQIDWHTTLRPALEREAPAFLASLFALPMPEAAGRLFLPVPMTEAKERAIAETVSQSTSTDFAGLAIAIGQLMARQPTWEGTASALQLELGRGEWSANPSHFARALKTLRGSLRERRIGLELPHRSDRTYRLKNFSS